MATRHFQDKFSSLIAHNVPRTFLHTPHTSGSDIPDTPHGMELSLGSIHPPQPGGFVYEYCIKPPASQQPPSPMPNLSTTDKPSDQVP